MIHAEQNDIGGISLKAGIEMGGAGAGVDVACVRNHPSEEGSGRRLYALWPQRACDKTVL
jgi:hypothetical protein